MRLATVVAAAFLAASPALADEIKKDFPILSVKYAGSTYSFVPSVTWLGERGSPNATARLYVSETGASGKITLSKILVTMTPAELRKLHSTLGDMVESIDGGDKKKPNAKAKK